MSGDVISYIIGAGGLCFGVYAYFTSGVLADKTKIIEQGMEQKHMKQDFILFKEYMKEQVKDMKDDIEELQEWRNGNRMN